ncbi:glyceraldehyde-3-phosphate dehydrogenase 2-like isoform X2 [Zingiber officinale]|uniref:glyceraldehyde-3-phosphate dehydrogenase 2-like isoform X2 n=1 Tax=Zingiber officinale TaxID=94328 RepID=UPI001C4D6583|nr:glyceraldehyde-3-phosphate dehydrogenase 2-like isoform X2 [Zingiber officinale]
MHPARPIALLLFSRSWMKNLALCTNHDNYSLLHRRSDASHRDLRRARAIALIIVLTNTGAAMLRRRESRRRTSALHSERRAFWSSTTFL